MSAESTYPSLIDTHPLLIFKLTTSWPTSCLTYKCSGLLELLAWCDPIRVAAGILIVHHASWCISIYSRLPRYFVLALANVLRNLRDQIRFAKRLTLAGWRGEFSRSEAFCLLYQALSVPPVVNSSWVPNNMKKGCHWQALPMMKRCDFFCIVSYPVGCQGKLSWKIHSKCDLRTFVRVPDWGEGMRR